MHLLLGFNCPLGMSSAGQSHWLVLQPWVVEVGFGGRMLAHIAVDPHEGTRTLSLPPRALTPGQVGLGAGRGGGQLLQARPPRFVVSWRHPKHVFPLEHRRP